MKGTTRRRFLAPMFLAPFGTVPAAAALTSRGAEAGATAAGWIVGELRTVTLGPPRSPRRVAQIDDLHRRGWLECTGQALDRDRFPELYEAIGDTWGAAPKGRFLLPDLRGFFLRGWETRRQQEIYEELMGGDLVKGRADEEPGKTRPENANVAYFIYAGGGVSRGEPGAGSREE